MGVAVDLAESRDLRGRDDMALPDMRACQPDEVLVAGDPGGPFCMDRTEVMVEAYQACVGAGGCQDPGMGPTRYCNWRNQAQQAKHPMNCLTWQQAMDYCTAHGKTLPSDQQWTFAARGAMNSKYPWGSAAPDDGQLCWKQTKGTCEVDRKKRTLKGAENSDGLADLAGNVWEMTMNNQHIRGAAWGSSQPAEVEAARLGNYDGKSNDRVGFRCVHKVN
jgi:formylglycine-generating enzyme required for sulfatase activity